MKALAALQVLSDDGERILCRGWRSEGNPSAGLAVLPVAEHPAPDSLARLAHEYGLREELDSDWAVRPLDLVRERDGTVLVLEDPGGRAPRPRAGRGHGDGQAAAPRHRHRGGAG